MVRIVTITGGQLAKPGNFFDDVRRMIDEMHCWYVKDDPDTTGIGTSLSGISVNDSMVTLEKSGVIRPVHSMVGQRRNSGQRVQ